MASTNPEYEPRNERYALYPYDDDDPDPPTAEAFYDQILLRAIWTAYDNALDMGLYDCDNDAHAASNWRGYLHTEIEALFDEWRRGEADHDEEPPAELLEFNFDAVYRRCIRRAPHVADCLDHPLYAGLDEIEAALGPSVAEELLEEL